MRACSLCRTIRWRCDFPASKKTRDGLGSWCRQCCRERASYYAHLPGAAARKAEYDREYRQANLERLQAECRERYAADRSRRIVTCLAWARNNPAARRIIRQAHKGRRRAQCEGGASGRDIRIWLTHQLMECVWCGAECAEDFEIDHVFPLSKGGVHELYNLAVACPTCNRRKSAKLPLEFALERENAAFTV